MEVKIGAEVGLKKTVGLGLPKIQTKSENIAHLPGKDVNNRSARDIERISSASRPSLTKDHDQVLGNTINIQA